MELKTYLFLIVRQGLAAILLPLKARKTTGRLVMIRTNGLVQSGGPFRQPEILWPTNLKNKLVYGRTEPDSGIMNIIRGGVYLCPKYIQVPVYQPKTGIRCRQSFSHFSHPFCLFPASDQQVLFLFIFSIPFQLLVSFVGARYR